MSLSVRKLICTLVYVHKNQMQLQLPFILCTFVNYISSIALYTDFFKLLLEMIDSRRVSLKKKNQSFFYHFPSKMPSIIILLYLVQCYTVPEIQCH